MDIGEVIKLVDDRMCYGRGQWSRHHQPEHDMYWEAGQAAIAALIKLEVIQTYTPPSDDWEHYADRLYDIAYQSGYEQGKKDAEDKV